MDKALLHSIVYIRSVPSGVVDVKMIEYKMYICIICGWVYDEKEGWPEDGIKPGTKWEDIPDDWVCPDCGASKEDFEMCQF